MTKNTLINQWRIWFSYLTEQQQKENKYAENLNEVHHIQTVEDLAYVWNESYVSQLKNFFTFNNQQKLTNFTYDIQGKAQIINSINFFKKNIQPSWQHEDNAKGGRMIFQIQRSQENYQQIYQALVFYFLGEDFQNSHRINGIRFISAKNIHILKSFYRVQIWVNFDESQTEKVNDFRDSFYPFLEKYKINNLKPSFRSNKETKK